MRRRGRGPEQPCCSVRLGEVKLRTDARRRRRRRRAPDRRIQNCSCGREGAVVEAPSSALSAFASRWASSRRPRVKQLGSHTCFHTRAGSASRTCFAGIARLSRPAASDQHRAVRAPLGRAQHRGRRRAGALARNPRPAGKAPTASRCPSHHKRGYAHMYITASMFSVRLCSAAGRQHGFSLQRARSGRERLNIIFAAHAKLRPVGVSDPTAPRPSVEVGVQASLECASAHAPGFPSRAASSHAPQRWSTHSWLPRRPRPWQAFACRAIMQRANRVDLALSSGDVARARPAEHNRTLNIGGGLIE